MNTQCNCSNLLGTTVALPAPRLGVRTGGVRRSAPANPLTAVRRQVIAAQAADEFAWLALAASSLVLLVLAFWI
jgi:hypothetical protein